MLSLLVASGGQTRENAFSRVADERKRQRFRQSQKTAGINPTARLRLAKTSRKTECPSHPKSDCLGLDSNPSPGYLPRSRPVVPPRGKPCSANCFAVSPFSLLSASPPAVARSATAGAATKPVASRAPVAARPAMGGSYRHRQPPSRRRRCPSPPAPRPVATDLSPHTRTHSRTTAPGRIPPRPSPLHPRRTPRRSSLPPVAAVARTTGDTPA